MSYHEAAVVTRPISPLFDILNSARHQAARVRLHLIDRSDVTGVITEYGDGLVTLKHDDGVLSWLADDSVVRISQVAQNP